MEKRWGGRRGLLGALGRSMGKPDWKAGGGLPFPVGVCSMRGAGVASLVGKNIVA